MKSCRALHRRNRVQLRVGQPLDGYVTALDGLRGLPLEAVNKLADGSKVAFLTPVDQPVRNPG